MKKLSLICLMIFSKYMFAQEPLASLELLTWTKNYSTQGNRIVTFTMQNTGDQVWASEAYNLPYYLTSVYYQSAQETIEGDGNYVGGLKGFNQSWHDQAWEQFGYGLYKMTISDSDNGERTYFYLDYRYCDQLVDCTIRFDNASNSAGIQAGVTSGGNEIGMTDIAPGSIVNIWEIREYDTPTISCFPFYWSNCLEIVHSPNSHPQLVWGPHPTFNSTHYRVYRAVSNYPVNPSSLTYSLISTVSSSTFDFIDYAVTILPDYQYAYYYVVGWNGTTQSAKTNYVSTQAEFQKHLMDVPADFSISQNYPNPFNPSTSISYSIPENAFVTLKIYDVLGNEVEVLINEQKEPGNYQIDFNASELSSGIYYYALTAGNFISTKKMSLVK